ncbi:hypothetical protein HDK64DRAFT_323254 [Phyllosticta capitalensis]
MLRRWQFTIRMLEALLLLWLCRIAAFGLSKRLSRSTPVKGTTGIKFIKIQANPQQAGSIFLPDIPTMHPERVVVFAPYYFYPNNGTSCQPDPDVAGTGVVISFVIAAIATTLLSVWTVLLDALVDQNDSVRPKILQKYIQIIPGRLKTFKWNRFWKKLSERLLVALADQQLLLGIALLCTGYIRSIDPKMVNTEIPFLYRLREPHFHLIIYLSCLSFSASLTSIYPLRLYHFEHTSAFILRVCFITLAGCLVATSITFALPFQLQDSGLLGSYDLFPYPDRCFWHYNTFERLKECDDHTRSSPIDVTYFFIIAINNYALFYPMCHCIFWAMSIQRGKSLPSQFQQRWFTILYKALPNLFFVQLSSVIISFLYTMAQKFAEPPEDHMCGLSNATQTQIPGSSAKSCL